VTIAFLAAIPTMDFLAFATLVFVVFARTRTSNSPTAEPTGSWGCTSCFSSG